MFTWRHALSLAGAAGATYLPRPLAAVPDAEAAAPSCILTPAKRFAIADGTRGLKIAIPNRVHGGAARLTLVVRDSAGNSKKIRRTVHIPR